MAEEVPIRGVAADSSLEKVGVLPLAEGSVGDLRTEDEGGCGTRGCRLFNIKVRYGYRSLRLPGLVAPSEGWSTTRWRRLPSSFRSHFHVFLFFDMNHRPVVNPFMAGEGTSRATLFKR